MTYVLPVLALLLAAALVARVLKARFEYAMPIALMGIGVLLYLFYIVGLLHIGFAIVVAIIGIGTVWSLIGLVRFRDFGSLKAAIVTPQVVTFVVVCIVCFFVTQNATVGMWDELRLWGAFPKLLHETGELQMGSTAELYTSMQSYLPGMPIIVYFFGAFTPAFHEPMIFFAYAVVASTFLLPVSRLLTWSRFYLIPVVVAVAIGVPLYFWNSFNDSGDHFGSLFIDTYLGLIAGFGCFLIATGAAHRRAGRVSLALTAITLFLFKESGLPFSVVLILAGLLQMVLAARGMRDPWQARAKRFFARAWVLVVPLGVIYASWKLLLNVKGLGGWSDSNYLTLKHSFEGVSAFADALLTKNVMNANIILDGGRTTIAVTALFLALAGALWFWLTGRRARRPVVSQRELRAHVPAIVVGVVALAAGCVVIFTFGHQMGGKISYVLVAAILAVVALGIYLRQRDDGFSRRRSNDLAVGLAAAALLNLFFVVGLYFLTTGPFAGVLYSFSRYMSTPLVLGMTFLVLYLTSRRWGVPRAVVASCATIAIAVALAVLIVLFPFRAPLKFDGGWDAEAAEDAASLLDNIRTDMRQFDEDSNVGVFLVFAGLPIDDAGLHHRIYFDLLGSGITIRNYYTETQIATETDSADESYDSDVAAAQSFFETQLATGTYDYVYVVEKDAAVSAQFDETFPGGVDEKAMYRVDREGAHVALERVN